MYGTVNSRDQRLFVKSQVNKIYIKEDEERSLILSNINLNCNLKNSNWHWSRSILTLYTCNKKLKK